MKEHLSKRNEMHISFYQDYLEQMYKNLNEERSPHDLYAYTDRTSGYLCKAILIDKAEATHFIRPVSWLFSLSTKLGIKLEESFLRRYPGICPYCAEMQCVCFKTDKKPLKPTPAYKVREDLFYRYLTIKSTHEPYNFDRAIKDLSAIYPVNEIIWHVAGPWHHIAKIHEEIAEVHEAYINYLKGDKPEEAVADEIADVLAWILGAWGIMFPHKSFDDAFIDYYYNGCPVCKQRPCACQPYSSRPAGLANYKQLVEIKKKLDDLAEVLPTAREQIGEIIRSYDVAVSTQHEPTALLAVSQTKDSLTKLKDLATDEESVSLINQILSAVDRFSAFT